MTVFRSRGQTVGQTEGVNLKALFQDFNGIPTDLDTFPTISIIQPSGNVLLNPTSVGVYRLNTGLYGYDYITGINTNIGVYTDVWRGTLNGISVLATFNFVVQNTQLPIINTDGYEALGDDPGFNYSQTAIHNINLLLKTLKARLNSAGKAKSKDQYGNDIFIDCDIYSADTLITFIANSLTWFNQIPHFTFFTFEDTDFIAQFHEILVQGATIFALASKALIERGREFQINDNGVSFTPPTVSELLNTQWSTELSTYVDMLKMIKGSMKPNPLGLGTLTGFSSGRNRVVANLRHRRQNQFF